MSDMTRQGMAKSLAVRIAGELFINGAGEEAQRLVLELPTGGNGGGWCQKAVIDRVEAILREEFLGLQAALGVRRQDVD